MSLFEDVRSLIQGFVQNESSPVEASPEPGVWHSGDRDDYDIDRSIRRQTTPRRLGDALLDADEGSTESQYELFEEVERDPKVARLYFRRRLAVVGKPLSITPFDDSTEAQKSAELCNQLIHGSGRGDGIRDFEESLFDLSDAIGKAFSVSQIEWSLDGGLWIPKQLHRWPQKEFFLGNPVAFRDFDADEIRVKTEQRRIDGQPLSEFPDGQWITHIQKAWSQPLSRAALFRSITWFWLFKKFGMKDWAIFLERIGIPPRIGKYSVNSIRQEREELWKAVKNMGKDHAAIIPDSATIELMKEAGGTNEAPHPAMVRHCNDEISVAIMGSTMATDQGDRGARSAKEAFQTDELEQAGYDARRLSKTIRQQLLAPIVRFNLGDAPVPKCEFQLDDYDDLESRSAVDEKLVGMGVPLGLRYFYESYDRPEPSDDEPVVEGGTPPVF